MICLKKLTKILLLSTFVFTLFFTTVNAATDLTELHINDETITLNDGVKSGTGWSFDGVKTVTLENYAGKWISAIGDLDVIIKGTNNVITEANRRGIEVSGGDLVVKGETTSSASKLIVNSGVGSASIITDEGNITIEKVTLEVKNIFVVPISSGTDGYKLDINNSIVKIDSTDATGISNETGELAEINILNSNIDINMSSDSTDVSGIKSSGNISILGTSIVDIDMIVPTTAPADNYNQGIISSKKVTVGGTSKVYITMESGEMNGAGIYTKDILIKDTGEVNIDIDGTVNQTGFITGITSTNNMEFLNNSILNITLVGSDDSGLEGLYAYDSIKIANNAKVTIDSSDQTADSLHYGIECDKLDILGGITDITLSGGINEVVGIHVLGELNVKDSRLNILIDEVPGNNLVRGIHTLYGSMIFDNSHVKITTPFVAAVCEAIDPDNPVEIKILNSKIMTPTLTTSGIRPFEQDDGNTKGNILSRGTEEFELNYSNLNVDVLSSVVIAPPTPIPNPDTSDNIVLYIVLATISILGIGYVIYKNRKSTI